MQKVLGFASHSFEWFAVSLKAYFEVLYHLNYFALRVQKNFPFGNRLPPAMQKALGFASHPFEWFAIIGEKHQIYKLY
jgi:hypothetical protein